jgi:alkylation response protein AidB-like acyl-CoA dehydrogenase
MTVAPPTAAALLDAARALAPQIAAHAGEIERERRLPDVLVQTLTAAGLFKMLLPGSVGGSELAPHAYVPVIEEIARADASTAWCLSQANGCATTAVFLDRSVAQEIFGADPKAVLAWGPPSEARAVAVEGGYRVTGRWSFASGCRHATWLGPSAPIVEADGTPRRLPDGRPAIRALLAPATVATFIDIWQVSGLRGTASDAFTFEDVFVPESHTAIEDASERREHGPLYQFPRWCLYASGFASVALGIARSMLDDLIALAGGKTPRATRGVLRNNAVVQAQVAHAEAAYRGARAFLHTTLSDAWEAVIRTGELPLEQQILIRLAGTDAIHRAASVADSTFQLAGATAIFESNPFERRFRDMHAVTQQIQARQAHYETVGQFFLGLEPRGYLG